MTDLEELERLHREDRESVYHLRLEYGPYTHRESVSAEDAEQAIAIAWGRLRRRGLLTLPMAYQSAHVESVEQ